MGMPGATAIAIVLAAAAPAGERLVLPPAPGFVVGFEQATAQASIVERIPRGETVEQWTRMITVQRFEVPLSPDALAGRIAAAIARVCPAAALGAMRTATGADGRVTAATARFDCPRNPTTRQPETFFLKVVQGSAMLHVVQVAFRHVPDPSEAIWAQAELDGATLCAAGAPDGACAAQ